MHETVVVAEYLYWISHLLAGCGIYHHVINREGERCVRLHNRFLLPLFFSPILLSQVRKAYAVLDFEWDNLKDLTLQRVTEENESMMRNNLRESLAEKDKMSH